MLPKENKLLVWALLERQSFGGWIWPWIWNSVVWKERENPQMGKQRNQDILTLKNVKRERKLGQKRVPEGQAFIAKELFSLLRIREAGCIGWRKKWDCLDPWEKPWATVRAISWSLTKTYRKLKSGELQHKAPYCSLTISPRSVFLAPVKEKDDYI